MTTVGVRLKSGEKRLYRIDIAIDQAGVEQAIRSEMPEAATILTLVADNKAPVTAPIEKESA